MKLLKVWLRLAIKTLRRDLRFSLFFVANLSIAFTALLFLETVRDSVTGALASQSQRILGADLTINSRRPLTEVEIEALLTALPKDSSTVRMVESLTMVKSPSKSRLVQIRAVEPGFPFYGQIRLKSGVIERIDPSNLSSQEIWLYPELFTQLNVEEGDQVLVGGRPFTVRQEVVDDIPGAGGFSSFAPRAYLLLSELEKTDLLGFGSTATRSWFAKIPASSDADAVVALIEKTIPDPAVRIQSHGKSGEQSGRVLDYLTDYLGLVALVGLFLAVFGSVFLFYSHVNSNIRYYATLRSMGFRPFDLIGYCLLVVLLLATTAVMISALVVFAAGPSIGAQLSSLLPAGISFALNAKSILAVWLAGVASVGLALFPVLVSLSRTKISTILLEGSHHQIQMGKKSWHLFLPALLVFWILAILQSHSFVVGSLFCAAFLASGLIVFGISFVAVRLLRHLSSSKNVVFSLILRSTSRRSIASTSLIVAVALASLLLQLLPQLKSSLHQELALSDSNRPSLFLFDIQEEQLEELKSLLQGRDLSLKQLSPLIRAQLEKINGVAFERASSAETLTREDEQSARTRNRGYNLTIRSQLSDSEKIVEGVDFPSHQNLSSAFPISLEFRFAQRMGIRLGDTLDFDVQGVSVQGVVVNLRRVRWTSFEPNFFIQFPPGPLDGAPKTFLAGIHGLTPDQKEDVQNAVVEKFGNISIVDVERTVGKLRELSERMLQILSLMSVISLIVGFLVVFSMASQAAVSRAVEFNLLKVLGLSHSKLRLLTALEFGFLGLLAGGLGAGASLALSWVLSRELFDGAFRPDGLTLVANLVVITAVSIIVSGLAVHRVLAQKPREFLLSGS